MEREQGPRDADAENRIDATDIDRGPGDSDRDGQMDSGDGAGGGSTTKSDI
jgi:hypothetical protein